jgi:3'(2'), 5'-bisphosphate nucleotidase
MAETVAERSGGEFVPLGSASYKRLAVVRGEVDAYLHAGGRYECDSAAPLGVALAAGPHALRIDGSPLAYNQPDPTLPTCWCTEPSLRARCSGRSRRRRCTDDP